MTLEELREKVQNAANNWDSERGHSDADDLLLEYIGDEQLKNIYENAPFYYA